MKRIFVAIMFTVAALASMVAYRTIRFVPRQVTVPAGQKLDALPGAVDRLAAAIRIPTVTPADSTLRDTSAFRTLREHLASSFPKSHSAMSREIVGRDALLFTWPGTDASLQPVVLMGHMDVVPVEAGTETKWTHAPFSGDLADGFVWGRGTLDDKATVLGLLEATETLLTSGFRPRRTIIMAFGGDEEGGGVQGAALIAKLLQSRGVKPLFVLDEGGMIVSNAMPGVSSPVAVVGIAEKGYVTLNLTAHAAGGHSSVPPRHTAAGRVARAVAKLEDNPIHGEIRGATANLFDAVGREMPFGMRALFANRWLFDPLIKQQLESGTRTNATIRTTTAVTMLEGSPKDNVLPSRAKAGVNFRILPGDSVSGIIAHTRRVIADEGIEVTVQGIAVEPSRVSSTSDSAWSIVDRSIRQSYPDAVVAPYLVLGATDSRYFRDITANVYRFAAMRADTSDVSRIHGTNERVSVTSYLEGIRFLTQLIRNAAQ